MPRLAARRPAAVIARQGKTGGAKRDGLAARIAARIAYMTVFLFFCAESPIHGGLSHPPHRSRPCPWGALRGNKPGRTSVSPRPRASTRALGIGHQSSNSGAGYYSFPPPWDGASLRLFLSCTDSRPTFEPRPTPRHMSSGHPWPTMGDVRPASLLASTRPRPPACPRFPLPPQR